MTKRVIGSVFFGIWLGCFTAAAQLPPDVMVDKYLLEAKMLSDEKDHRGALEAMERIVALQKEHALTLPEAFSFHYAQAALAAGAVQGAIDSVNWYLTVAGRQGQHYREALELLVKAERMLLKPDVQRAASGAAEPAIEAQPQAVPPSSPQAQKKTAAQPVVDCSKWNTKNFFQKATVENVTVCLETGADPTARTNNKRTPLHFAARYNEDPAVIEALLSAGADPMARGKWNSTPLHWAVESNGNPAVVEALLKAEADPNARNDGNSTPLHWAAESNENPAVVEALLKAGADPNVRNDEKDTPLDNAKRSKKNPAVVGVLRKAKAERERQLEAARPRRESQSSGGWAALVAGVTGAAIGAAGGLDAATATELGAAIGGSVLAGEAGGNTGGGHSPTPIGADGTSSEFDTALRNLENGCGERYRSAFSEQDHGRFYCLDAFARHCALKKGPNQKQLDALRRDFEVLRSQGQESGCPYFGVFGVTYAPGFKREAIDRAEKEARKARQEEQRRLEEQAKQAAQKRKRLIEENNARVLASDCSCIRISEEDGELTCLDGFVGMTCDIKR